MSAMLAYLDQVSSHGIDLARLVVFWLFIAANAGVVVGVVLENEKNSHATKEMGWRLLVLSLGLEIFFSSVTFGIDSEIGRRQNAEIIALRKNSLPRSINVATFSEQLAAAPPSTVEIRYVMACTDCEWLSFWLSEAFRMAHWSVNPPIPINPPDRNWPRAVSSLHAPQQSGISIVVNSPEKITADPKTSLGALNHALSATLGFNFFGYDAAVMGGIDVTMPPDVIRVVIAPRA